MMNQRATEVGEVAPASLSDLIGQQSVIAQVGVALHAAAADGTKFPSSLLTGGPGLGKSCLAHVISHEMGTRLHEALGQSITTSADLNALLLGARDRDVVHLDEAHELEKPFQTSLLTALDQRRIFLNGGRSGRAPQSIPLADFCVLLSTTDEYSLVQPLRDRMRLVLRFQFYGSDDIARVVRQRSEALGWEVEDDVLPLIAQRSRGTPRLALRLLQACHRVCRSENQTTITLEHLRHACRLEQIDPLGLGPTERQYMDAVAGGSSRLNVIGSVLGLPSRTVSQVVEPFLIRAGLLVKDDQGRRQLTAEGREHLSHCRQHGV